MHFIIAWLLPLVGFVVLVFRGRRSASRRRLPGGGTDAHRGGHLAGLRHPLGDRSIRPAPERCRFPGFASARKPINFGVHIDSLTIVMFTMVTVVASCIFVYSIGYMHGDPRFPRFFTYLSLFGFSMLGLVLSDSLIGLFIFWELVGLCSYFLIGFWFEKTSASNAAKKAFIVNRMGDFLFLIGIATMLAMTGVVSLDEVFEPGAAGGVRRTRRAADVRGDLPVLRGGGQERPVPSARLAARRDGRSRRRSAP